MIHESYNEMISKCKRSVGVLDPEKAGFLSKSGLGLRLQPELDQAADGLGPSRHIGLPPAPAVYLLQLIIMPPLANQRAHAS